MSKNLFITATEARSGKSAISLGIMELLLRNIDRVAFFKPVINSSKNRQQKDHDIELVSTHFDLEIPYEKMYAFTISDASDLLAHGKDDEFLEGIFTKYKEIEKTHDFVLCEGTDYDKSTSAFEFDINAEVASNLACPVLLTANAHQKSIDDLIQWVEASIESLMDKGCKVIATIANRIDPKDNEMILNRLQGSNLTKEQLLYTISENKSLGSPTMEEIASILNAEILYGQNHLHRHVYGFTIGAMQLKNVLDRIKHGSLIITPGDRADIIVACLSSLSSMSLPNIAGMLLTGGLKPEEPICKLIEGFSNIVPILSVTDDTFPIAKKINEIHATISPHDNRKIIRALEIFEKNIAVNELSNKIIETQTTTVTPKMFEYGLLERAKSEKQHIVLPEGDEERILKAVETLLRREIVDITLLGNEEKILKKISKLRLHIDTANIIDPCNSDFLDNYAEAYYKMRKHKGITKEMAYDYMSDVSFYGTMMVHKGDADGMVSGAVHTTQATVRPAFEIIKTKPGCSVVSSVFFMCLEDRVLVYGDCAINPDPNAEKLAEIAISAVQTAKIFGIDPKVAMLSYSTGESGKGEDVEKVRKATIIAREAYPDLKLEGPIQYDAAVDPAVAKTKMPNSKVAGQATIFIFPDLNTGNNTYKAVQRSAGAVAIGPVLQGLNKPVNDLSRGCKIADIINTIAITAIQAQAEKG